MFSLSGTFAV